MPENSRSLWSAVKIAKDTGINDIPQNVYLNGKKVAGNKVAESFAQFFDDKVSKIVHNPCFLGIKHLTSIFVQT